MVFLSAISINNYRGFIKMKTDFEKFYAKVIKELKKQGVNIVSNLGRISDIITDYYGQTDMKYIIQCIMFELKRGFGREKAVGIREATEFVPDEDPIEFIDQVLDELDKYADKETYDYYFENRDEILEYIEDNINPAEVAEILSKNFTDDKFEYTDKADIDDDTFEILESLYRSNAMNKRPVRNDGRFATESFPISFAISENDVDTLEDYYENGIPLSIVTGDEDDDEIIPWEEQYKMEFAYDYALLTRYVAIEKDEINDALDFMLEKTNNFIVPLFDMYNLFVSSKTDTDILKELLHNYEKVTNMDDEYFYEDITLDKVKTYMKKQ